MHHEIEIERDSRILALWSKVNPQNHQHLDVVALRHGLGKIKHSNIQEDEAERLIQAADSDSDGRIDYSDFHRFVTATESRLWRLFSDIDKDENGKVDKQELRLACTNAGLAIPGQKLDAFFREADLDHDGTICFDEWRDFLLFVPPNALNLKTIMSSFTPGVRLTSEGDVHLHHDTIQSIGKHISSLAHALFGSFDQLFPKLRTTRGLVKEPLDVRLPSTPSKNLLPDEITELPSPLSLHRIRDVLTGLLPDPGYFLAGGMSGVTSRTLTAPLDRLKVYLIAQTGQASATTAAAKQGSPLLATKRGLGTISSALQDLWAAGGIRSLFAGNGLNVVKVMPESALKFGSYEAAKRVVSQIEGHNNPRKISSLSQFVAGGVAGMVSHLRVPFGYAQINETVKGGLHGNALILQTARKMWSQGGFRTFYRGLTMGLVGMFPYAAIDLGTFEFCKRKLVARNMRLHNTSAQAALPNSFALALMGGFSGAFGASMVYPLNLLRTRLQCQGTASHPRTYTGFVDVARQTVRGEGVRGLFKGLTPNLFKVIPAVSITYVVYENTKKALNLP